MRLLREPFLFGLNIQDWLLWDINNLSVLCDYSGPHALRRYSTHPWVPPFGPAFGCLNYKYLPWYLPLRGQLKLFKFIPDEFVDAVEFVGPHYVRSNLFPSNLSAAKFL